MAKALCFPRDDFLGATFDAGEFVSTRQGSVSLEKLRDDLQKYTEELKDRLYELINRDYADFVKISSKLTGVDEVVEVIASPLRGIRDEVGELHGAIRDMRAEMEAAAGACDAARRARLLTDDCIAFLDRIEHCEHLLNIHTPEEDGEEGDDDEDRRSRAPARRGAAYHSWELGGGLEEDLAALRRSSAAPPAPAPADAGGDLLFEIPAGGKAFAADPRQHRFFRRCVALERAAMLAEELDASMRGLAAEAGALRASDAALPGVESALSVFDGFAASLGTRLERLEREANLQVSSLFAAAVAPPESAVADQLGAGDGPAPTPPAGPTPRGLGLSALLRAASRLRKTEGLPLVFGRAVLSRYLDARFTASQLDGDGPRGGCASLPALLSALLAFLSARALPALRAAEAVLLRPSPSPDLLVDGVVAALRDRFAGPLTRVYAPGAAGVQARNLRALEAFLKALCARVDGSGRAAARAARSAPYAEVLRRFDLRVHAQLRRAALSEALEAAIGAVERGGVAAEHAPEEWLAALLAEGGALRLGGRGVALPAVGARGGGLHGAALRCACAVVGACFAEEVALAPVLPELLESALGSLSRLGEWAAGALAALRGGAQGAWLKGPEEALMLGEDCAAIAHWVAEDLAPAAADAFAAAAAGALGAPDGGGAGVAPPTRDGLRAAAAGLGRLRAEGWACAAREVAKRCGESLGGMRGISAAYRFTGKKAPEEASAYVGGVLRPLRAFEGEWGEGDGLREAVARAVLAALREEAGQLVQSVRQMEDALSRRANRGNRPDALSDGDKILMQLRIDAATIGEDLRALGVDVDASDDWKAVMDVVGGSG